MEEDKSLEEYLNSEELQELKQEVLMANLMISTNKLAALTWGNVSGINQDRNLIIIKPSGVSYEEMGIDEMVVVSFKTGKVLFPQHLKPSTDLPTHLLLYKTFPELKGICHTHSTFATSWAQAGEDIPVLGTTHADNFIGPIPCTRDLKTNEVEKDYEFQTGMVIVEEIQKRGLSIENVPGILVKEHGVFSWSTKNSMVSVEKGITIEEIAKMAIFTKLINPSKKDINPALKNKHFQRKNGPDAYYGQDKDN